MAYIIPPASRAVLADANNVAPGRSRASDGTIGDLRHQAQGSKSDHNPAADGVVYAVDITNDPDSGMDTWVWAQHVAARMAAGLETRVRYLVSNDGDGDVIFNPSVSMRWRRQTSTGNEHANHLHVSWKHESAAVNNVLPFFVGSTTATPATKPPPPPPKLTSEEDDLMPSLHYPPQNQTHTFWRGATTTDGKVRRDGHLLHAWRGNAKETPHAEDMTERFGIREWIPPGAPISVFLDPVGLDMVVSVPVADGALLRLSWLGASGPWVPVIVGR